MFGQSLRDSLFIYYLSEESRRLPFTASLNALRGQKAICEIESHI